MNSKPPPVLQGKRILVVDDEVDLREVVCEVFQFMGASVQSAENGIVGFELARQSNPHVILSDIRMPGGDGMELLRNVRAYRFSQAPKFFLMTAFSDLSDEEMANLPIEGILTKPFSLAQLRDLILGHLIEEAS